MTEPLRTVAQAPRRPTEAAATDGLPGSETVQAHRIYALGAAVALVALVVLTVAWERWLAPLRPGGSALIWKALPLAAALPGVLRRRLYTFQWASMLVLLYFMEGIVRGMSDAGRSAWLGWLETGLATLFLACALAYVAPFKRAARRRLRAGAASTEHQQGKPPS
ncbi:DUF2069 domain-containing protein [Trinickia caryophylli]|uniref:Uncharacterized membrane protein n=1 Tax=Trinickia caryophylli TaxID=28094 RepID=A0A1X7CMR9_TRICW|nr:DUF2069 domain-containing protein [Trinickia caryophylli]PMS11233.1 DUF2069 domain-containing protein [Trinickia caryophylli]TRX20088.1 DUF2069 domain-containing protein [Trinickia caryophylli]WQE12562.1 DUF2069 domain-containing protein [Trinickia caryophylli]SME99666.1 Uncharacterized membrane protein [Trinickia caryophylli]GLU30252.1 hypothetical protein Busp01_00940 [Trinickia caryophylli]